MATINAKTVNDLQNAGASGNSSDAVLRHTQVGVGTIGDKIRLGVIPGGSLIHTVREVHSAHGGTATGSLGSENVDGTAGGSAAYFAAAASVVAAGALALAAFDPVLVEKDVYITFTNAASAIPDAATIAAVVCYKNVGVR